jgi:hypothetical protein
MHLGPYPLDTDVSYLFAVYALDTDVSYLFAVYERVVLRQLYAVVSLCV